MKAHSSRLFSILFLFGLGTGVLSAQKQVIRDVHVSESHQEALDLAPIVEEDGVTIWPGSHSIMLPAALPAEQLPTHRADQAIGFELDEASFQFVRARKPNRWNFVLPLPDGGSVELELESFLAFKSDLVMGRTTTDGEREEAFRPGLLSYRVVNPGMSGVVNVMKDHVLATFRLDGQQWELSPAIGAGYGGLHALFRTADNRLDLSFSCGVEDLAQTHAPQLDRSAPSSNMPTAACVEIGLDVDYSTFATFSDANAAGDWALAMLAGVSAIYEAELGNAVTLSATYLHIWEAADPYAAFVNNSGGMLEEFRSTWYNDAPFTDHNWDLCHLLTKRTNTGTGGIAYVGVLCDPIYSAYGAGFSSGLDNMSVYTAGTYAWNLNVVAHELGHNFGSNHTHWCGWSTGPIDNCYTLEGDCGA
jgi:hypothetical protein